MTSHQPSIFDKVEAMRQAAAQREAERQAAIKSAAEENRRRMPTIAAWVESDRDVFGDDVKVVYASENGIVRGAPSPAGMPLSEITIGGFSREKLRAAGGFKK